MLFIKEIFTDTVNRLKSILDTASQPAIRFIDFDLGQLDDAAPPVSYPCVLIGFGNTADFFTKKDGAQSGIQSVTLTVAFKRYERTNSLVATQYQTQALAMLDVVEAIHQATQHKSGDCYGALKRTGVAQEQRADLRVFTMTYEVGVYSDAPVGVYVPIVTAPEWVAAGSVPVSGVIEAELTPMVSNT